MSSPTPPPELDTARYTTGVSAEAAQIREGIRPAEPAKRQPDAEPAPMIADSARIRAAIRGSQDRLMARRAAQQQAIAATRLADELRANTDAIRAAQAASPPSATAQASRPGPDAEPEAATAPTAPDQAAGLFNAECDKADRHLKRREAWKAICRTHNAAGESLPFPSFDAFTKALTRSGADPRRSRKAGRLHGSSIVSGKDI